VRLRRRRCRAAAAPARIDAFLARAAREGAIRADVEVTWVRDVLLALIDLARHGAEHAHLSPGTAADRVTETFLRAVGPAAA
jgi:hypothetical protein